MHIKAAYSRGHISTDYATSSGREEKREKEKERREDKTREGEKIKLSSVMLTGARRAREFRVNELICIENEDLDDDGRYASDDDRDDAPSVSGMRDLAL